MTSRLITDGRVAGECICGHDQCDGLDCGVFLPGQAPRKRMSPKSTEEIRRIRAQAWATRRAKYGKDGHR